jgi:signal transduction histidine kinase
LVRLVHLSIAEDGTDSTHILQRVTELAASGLQVARASIWLRDSNQDAIVCQDLFDHSQTHKQGLTLLRKDYPKYFTELDRSVVIPAENAHTHPATSCFSAAYLSPLGIGSMLDAPIWRGGKAVGVLCFEHVGGPREWSESDRAFAAQVALISGLYYERQERLTAERVLRQREAAERTNQKMEALGRMACVIGHDFNNLLTTMVGQTEMLLRPNVPNEQVRHRAGVVLEAASRAGALVKRLLNFGKGRDATVGHLNLVDIITAIEPVLRSAIPARIVLECRLPNTPMTILADTVSLEQIIMNLVVNAKDAISGDGTITITVSRSRDSDGSGSIVMTVTDTGCGMDEATLFSAFEPFYTTKGEHGTGLGLSTCFSNMRALGGSISIASNPGHGTTCTCTFPARG